MKKTILLFLIAVIFSGYASSQNLISLNHMAGGSEFFTRLDSAVSHATSGDYIIIPGTSMMNIGNVTINKGVNIIGAGINPDSCLATGTTILTGNITIVDGSSNGSLQGVMLYGDLKFGTSVADQHVENYYVSRCNLSTVYLSFSGIDTTNSTFLFRENIIRGHIYGGNSAAIFRNNIIEAQLNYFTGATFANNDFLWGNSNTIDANVRNSTFSNNIFKNGCFVHYGWWIIYSTDNNYYNNMYNSSMKFNSDYYGCSTTPFNGLGFIAGNKEFVDNSLIYTNQAGNNYNIHDNYHLVAGSPGANAGTDGTDIGIYGGSEPFKDGSLPVNPHISFQNVAGSTNPDGTLNIHFRVEAQTR